MHNRFLRLKPWPFDASRAPQGQRTQPIYATHRRKRYMFHCLVTENTDRDLLPPLLIANGRESASHITNTKCQGIEWNGDSNSVNGTPRSTYSRRVGRPGLRSLQQRQNSVETPMAAAKRKTTWEEVRLGRGSKQNIIRPAKPRTSD